MYLCSCGTWDLHLHCIGGDPVTRIKPMTQAPDWEARHWTPGKCRDYSVCIYVLDSRKQNFQHCLKQFLMHEDVALSGGVASMFT